MLKIRQISHSIFLNFSQEQKNSKLTVLSSSHFTQFSKQPMSKIRQTPRSIFPHISQSKNSNRIFWEVFIFPSKKNLGLVRRSYTQKKFHHQANLWKSKYKFQNKFFKKYTFLSKRPIPLSRQISHSILHHFS